VTLHFLPPVPSLQSPLHSPDLSCSGPLEVCPLVSKGFESFPKNYFVNYYIDICDIPQFHVLYSFKDGTVWDSVHFLLFLLYISIIGSLFLLFGSQDMGLSLNCSRESWWLRSFAHFSIRPSDGSFGVIKLVMRKSSWRAICLLWFVSHLKLLIRLFNYISVDEGSFCFSTNIRMSFDNSQ